MERSLLADELYSEAMQKSQERLDAVCNKQSELDDNLWGDDDGTLWDNSDENINKSSDLDREWQKRRDQFHTIGYRDGVIAGKEASAQEGFNIGFKESVLGGRRWGFVRGVTSALACLPDGIKEKLVETEEMGNKLESLHEAAHSISTTDALKLLYNNIMTNKKDEQCENVDAGSSLASLQDQSMKSSILENYSGELQLLLRESPKIDASLMIDR